MGPACACKPRKPRLTLRRLQITAMGIPEDRAIEVFLMCDRNVELAIQYYYGACKAATRVVQALTTALPCPCAENQADFEN